MFLQKFSVRWNDLDANRHLANSSYVTYCADARMGFMRQNKMGLSQLNRWGVGPVLLHERYSFFREILADSDVWVSVELSGASEDGGMYEFTHRFFLEDGTHCATATAMGVWIDVMLRKSTTPPEDIQLVLKEMTGVNTRNLSPADLKSLPFRQENINPESLR